MRQLFTSAVTAFTSLQQSPRKLRAKLAEHFVPVLLAFFYLRLCGSREEFFRLEEGLGIYMVATAGKRWLYSQQNRQARLLEAAMHCALFVGAQIAIGVINSLFLPTTVIFALRSFDLAAQSAAASRHANFSSMALDALLVGIALYWLAGSLLPNLLGIGLGLLAVYLLYNKSVVCRQRRLAADRAGSDATETAASP